MKPKKTTPEDKTGDKNPNPLPIKELVFTSLFAALTAVGSYIIIPLPVSPVPIVLQNMFVLLCGLLLGPVRGVVSIGLYLILGLLGLPIFSAGGGGIAHLAGPTGGYLLSYIPAVFVVGKISELSGSRKVAGKTFAPGDARKVVRKNSPVGGDRKSTTKKKRTLFYDSVAVFIGILIVYAGGVPWLKMHLGTAWTKTLMLGLVPYLPGDIIKGVAAVFVADTLRPLFFQCQIYGEETFTDDDHES